MAANIQGKVVIITGESTERLLAGNGGNYGQGDSRKPI